MRPRLPDRRALEPYLRSIDNSRVYTNFGPLYAEFAVRLSDYLGVKPEQIALFANGTLALQAAIETAGGEGDTWVLPSWTFVASAQAVKTARRRVHFVDVNLDDWSIEPESRTFATGHVVVSPFGSQPQISQWNEIEGFKVFDAASCFDSCAQIGDQLNELSMVMVSLHATKSLPAGEGAFLVGPEEWIHRARCWGNFGFDGSRIAVSAGLNAKISEYHCAVGLASLDSWLRIRSEYQDRLTSLSDVARRLSLFSQPSVSQGFVSTTWNLLLNSLEVSSIEYRLNKFGVQTRRWWPCGVHEMPEFQNCTMEPMPNTQYLSSGTLGLPFSVDLTEAEIQYIEEVLGKALLSLRRT